MLISNKINQVQEKLSNYAQKIYYKEICGLKAGIVFIDYEYRNDLAEYFRQNSFDMDFVMLIALDYGTISYRNIKDDVNVRVIAEAMGGKGHDKAASSPIREEQKKALIELLTEQKQNIVFVKILDKEGDVMKSKVDIINENALKCCRLLKKYFDGLENILASV